MQNHHQSEFSRIWCITNLTPTRPVTPPWTFTCQNLTPADGATRLVGSPHLSCKCDQIKMRDHMDRRVTPPERVTSPSWGPPPPCKQALIGSALALSEIKKVCCKPNHSSLSSMIIEAAFLWHKFTPRGKIFSVLWTTVVRSELPREFLPWTDFSPPHRKTPRPIKMVFDDIWPYSLCRSYGEFRQLARQTRHWHDWRSRHTCTCDMLSHSCPMM